MDWIFVVLAWSLLAVGLSLLVWSLLWDRSRGRRRCPKCWYGMDGVPASEGARWTCPECGRAVAKERKLLRTRRRWGFATLAVVVLLGSYASHAAPGVRSRGWWAAAPDLVVIALLANIDAFDHQSASGGIDNAFRDEVSFRSRATPFGSNMTGTNPPWVDGDLWPWERWLLHRQALKLLADAEDEFEQEDAVWLCVLGSSRLDAGVPGEHVASAVVARSLLAYERCEHYVDYGVHVSVPGVGPHPYELFVTGMTAPDLFRYEQRDRHPFAGSDWMRKVVWRDRSGALSRWWTVTENQGIERPGRLGLALSSVHHDVSGALFPAEEWSSPHFLSEISEFVGEAELVGRRVYHLRGINGDGDVDELWIDAETFMVRRARNAFGDTWYVPLVGKEAAQILDDSWWSFDPGEQADAPLERLDADLQVLLDHIDIPSEEERLELELQRIEQRYRQRDSQ